MVTPYHMERCWSVSLSLQGYTLHPGQLAEWEGKVLGPRARRSMGNLSKARLSPAQHLPPFPLSAILDGKGSFPATASYRGFIVELPIFWGTVRPLHLRQSTSSLTLPGTGHKAWPVTAAKTSSEGSRHPGKVCRSKQMDVA